MSSSLNGGYEKNTLFNQNQEQHIPDEFVGDQNKVFLQLVDGLLPVLVTETNCTPPSILEFPSDGLTRQERQSGWIAIHALIACYCFWLIAIVCDDYFVPVIDSLCESACVLLILSPVQSSPRPAN